MKNGMVTFIFLLFCTIGFLHNYWFQNSGRLNPQLKKEKLNEVNFVSEITPELWSKMQLQYDLHSELEIFRKTDFSQVYFVHPQDSY